MRWLLVLAFACGGTPKKPPPRPESNFGGAESPELKRKRWVAELSDEILSSYDRDDLPDIETTMIPPQVGPARIGVGPGDVLFGDDVRKLASSRWPLYLGSSVETDVRSKDLDVHLAHDRDVSAAWMSDEVSWRITICGHIAVFPLRMTALYAHDGDRWVEVFEHLSWARVPVAYEEGLRGAAMVAPHENPIVDRKLADELSRVLSSLLSRQPARVTSVVSLDPTHKAEDNPSAPAPTLLLAPDPEGEWHGDQEVEHMQLVAGTLRAEDRRIGTVGPDVEGSTIAYWIGNFVAELRNGTKVRLRGTFVFEKRDGRWIIVQGHLSEPIDDFALATEVLGSSLAMSEEDFLRKKPLVVSCDDGRRQQNATAPAPATSGQGQEAGSR